MMQQIAYLMSAVTNQTNLNKNGGCTGFKSNGNSKYQSTTFQRPKKYKKTRPVGDLEAQDIVGESAPPTDKGIIFLKPNPPSPSQSNGQNLNGQQGEETQPSNPLPVMTREESTLMRN